jgi:hypothetical protein
MQLLINENSWIAKIAAHKLQSDNVAFVIGRTIHLYHVSKEDFLKDEKWVRHEMCHIRQFKEHGFFPFIFKYLLESLRRGYYQNKYEIEARMAENE